MYAQLTIDRFVDILKVYKKENALTYAELSDLAGISDKQLCMWCGSKERPRARNMAVVIQRLGLNKDYIFAQKADHRRTNYGPRDWEIFKGPCRSYEYFMRQANVDAALDVLQEITLSLYRYFNLFNFPVSLRMSCPDTNEQLHINFVYDTIDAQLGPHQLTVYGGGHDKVRVNLSRIIRLHGETHDSRLSDGVLTPGWLKYAMEQLMQHHITHTKTILDNIKTSEKFAQYAEGNSVM